MTTTLVTAGNGKTGRRVAARLTARALTFGEAVAEIAAATGRDLGFESVPLDAYTDVLAGVGVTKEEIALLGYLFGEVLDGRNEAVTDGIERALGRPPRDFADYARTTAATGVWNA